MTNIRRGYAAQNAESSRRTSDPTRSDAARARSIERRNARALKRAAQISQIAGR